MLDGVNMSSQNSHESFGAAESRIQQELGKDAFLRLLVTQLNYQDPLAPMQNEAFVAQLAQFSALEQMQNINRNLEESINADILLNKAMNNSLVTTLIGKDVVANTNLFSYSKDGSIELGFRLSSPAREVTIEIYDSNGQLVRTLKMEGLSAGEHFFQWNGQDQKGKEVPEGQYTFRVSVKDGENRQTLPTFIRGTITGVRYEEGVAYLLLGDLELSLGDVQKIVQS
ncbi:MAG: FlgD immunoglobulin-like domain containing protein [candidate division KSB1 bacterium]|nr:FlgD immunoglobulin-like domain containing protein [candidate division KSB1 bacterium]